MSESAGLFAGGSGSFYGCFHKLGVLFVDVLVTSAPLFEGLY